MNRARVALCGFGLVFALAAMAGADEFQLGSGSGKPGSESNPATLIPIPVKLVCTDQVQGVQAVVEWDNSLVPAGQLRAVDITWSADFTGADQEVKRVGLNTAEDKGFFLLGSVLDTNGTGKQFVDPGTYTVATVRFVWELGAETLPGSFVSQDIPLNFIDAKYSAADVVGAPTLDNIVVVGGLSFTPTWVTPAGVITLLPPPPGTLTIENTTGFYGDTVAVKVLLDCGSAVQGFQTSIQHQAGLTLEDIVLGTAAAAADFTDVQIYLDGGTFGVVMDLYAPYTGATIAAGMASEIAVYQYSTPPIDSVTECPAGRPANTFDLTFADNVYGSPLIENLLVIVGLSKNPDQVDGKLSLSTKPGACFIPAEIDRAFAVGGCDLVDDPASNDKDIHKPSEINVTRGTTALPGKFQVGLYYRWPPVAYENDEGENNLEHIQGLSMALQFDTDCILCDGTYSLAGTITETVGAEFVNILCENVKDTDAGSDNLDGKDPGELIVGILVDALPPFDGRDLPPTQDYLKLVCVDFHVANPTGACDTCNDVLLHFPEYPLGGDVKDPVTGIETPVIRNLVSIRKRYCTDPADATTCETLQESWKPKQLIDGWVHILKEPTFVRGDCNWSEYVLDDEHTQFAVDISDAAAVISYLFLTGTWQVLPKCLDACDANDDGRVDLADAVYILRYLFKFGTKPPMPFPDPGIDTTSDRLDCDAGTVCE